MQVAYRVEQLLRDGVHRAGLARQLPEEEAVLLQVRRNVLTRHAVHIHLLWPQQSTARIRGVTTGARAHGWCGSGFWLAGVARLALPRVTAGML